MLRPATPLSVVLLVAFVMLLFTAISVPVTKIVPLGEFNNVKYGAFGYCDGDKCSSIGLGYPGRSDPGRGQILTRAVQRKKKKKRLIADLLMLTRNL